MNKLRLLLTEDCNRNCEGCCNKDWDLAALPVEINFSGYEMVMLTGGEPMLHPMSIVETVQIIREQNPAATIIMYTAKTDQYGLLLAVLTYIDGLTVTIHDKADWKPFLQFNKFISLHQRFRKLLRLNVFEQAGYAGFEFDRFWEVKKDIVWVKECPLPENEVFMKL